jgi:hypothetical protein
LPEPGVRLFAERGLGPLSRVVSFEASDDKGGELGTGRAYLSPLASGFSLTLYLKEPSAEATSIKNLHVDLELEVAGAVEEVKIEDLTGKVGEDVEAGPLRFRIESAKDDKIAFTVQGEGKSREGRFVRSGTSSPPGVRLFDGEGNRVTLIEYRIEGDGGKLHYSLVLSSVLPSELALAYDAVKGREKMSFGFDFETIPLRK